MESGNKLIDGRALAKKIEQEVALGVAELKSSKDITPGLATILVGDDERPANGRASMQRTIPCPPMPARKI